MKIVQINLDEVMDAISSGDLFNDKRRYYIVATKTNKLIPVKNISIGQLPGWASFEDAAFIRVDF